MKRNATFDTRHSTFVCGVRRSTFVFGVVGYRLSIVLFVVMTLKILAFDDSISPAFIFDARYESSGVSPEAWANCQAEGLSSRFTMMIQLRSRDDNGNGIPDAWDARYGLLGDSAAPNADPDGDGCTNREEYNAGTNPILNDDWMSSIVECDSPFVTDTRVWYTGGNPSFGDAFAVVKVSNGFVCDTGGLYYDWDYDGIPNWWEARFSRDGSKVSLSVAMDDDCDGQTNYDEFVACADPTNSTSKFVIGYDPIVVKSIARSSMQLLSTVDASDLGVVNYAITWKSAVGRIYSVYMTEKLSDGWSDTPIAELVGTGEEIQYVPERKGDSQFYKVSVRLCDDY